MKLQSMRALLFGGGLFSLIAAQPALSADIFLPALACGILPGAIYQAPAPEIPGNFFHIHYNTSQATIRCPIVGSTPALPTSFPIRSMLTTYRSTKDTEISVNLEEVPNDVSRLGTSVRKYELLAPNKARTLSNPTRVFQTPPAVLDFSKNYYYVTITLKGNYSSAAGSPEFYGITLRDYVPGYITTTSTNTAPKTTSTSTAQ